VPNTPPPNFHERKPARHPFAGAFMSVSSPPEHQRLPRRGSHRSQQPPASRT
jgi:hypothetical protein